MVSNIVGQVTNPAVGELKTETQSVALGEASSVVADVSIGVGKLNISGGATDLMNATFNYNIAAWKPIVSYNVNATEGTLLVQQPSQGAISTAPNTRYEWDLRFKNDVPTTMKVDIGVGEGNLRFAGLDLRSLEVNSGVGDTTVDLTGLNAQQDVSVLVKGGVGQVTIIVPTDTGVRVTADGGLGNINANGMTVNGNTYTNTAYGTTSNTIKIDVKTGIGNIQLVQGR
jgi:predicted membrane protein